MLGRALLPRSRPALVWLLNGKINHGVLCAGASVAAATSSRPRSVLKASAGMLDICSATPVHPLAVNLGGGSKYPNAFTNADADRNPYLQRYKHQDSYVHPYPDAHSVRNAELEPDIHPFNHAHLNSNSHGNFHVHSNANLDTDDNDHLDDDGNADSNRNANG